MFYNGNKKGVKLNPEKIGFEPEKCALMTVYDNKRGYLFETRRTYFFEKHRI